MTPSTDVVVKLREHCLPVGPFGIAGLLDSEEKKWAESLSDSQCLALFQWLQAPADSVGEQRLPGWLRQRMVDRAAYWCGLSARQEPFKDLQHAILHSLQNPATAIPGLLVAQEWKHESVLPSIEALAEYSDPALLLEVANCLLEIATPKAIQLLGRIVKNHRDNPGLESIARSYRFEDVDQ